VWKIQNKPKYKNDYIYINMFSIVGLFEETRWRREGKRERNDKEWMILKYIISV
jgi:hypothetical protein